jgi:hypothetical protein
MAKRNPDGRAPEGLLERSADLIGETLGTAVRRMEDLGGRARAGAAAATREVRKAARRTTRRIKLTSRRTRGGTRTTTARRKSTRGMARKKR